MCPRFRFQQVIERVIDALAADPEAQRLLARMVEDLKAETETGDRKRGHTLFIDNR